VLIVLERAKSSILPNGNFREFFLWRGGEFCIFKTGIPGGPGATVPVSEEDHDEITKQKLRSVNRNFCNFLKSQITLTILCFAVQCFYQCVVKYKDRIIN